MALVIKGRIVPLASDPAVSASPFGTFAGRVWLGDDGLVAAVTKGSRAGPPGFEGAAVVDVGSSLVFPGLVDLHNHLLYNTLPLWTEPTRDTPWLHHNSWPGAKSYAASVTWPAYALATAAPHELLAYVETKAVVGGVTSVQGSPAKNRPRDGWLVRNIEDESFGTGDRNRIYSSALTVKPAALARRANQMRDDHSVFIYHCAEGQLGSIVTREYDDAQHAGCLVDRFVAIHCNALVPQRLDAWSPAGAIVWSPLSNLWLYGTTTDVPSALQRGLSVCLGSDWSPSGSKNLLGELKVARIVCDERGWDISDRQLVAMATTAPGDMLARGWGRQVGRLQPGAIGDVVVVRARPRVDAFRRLVGATEADIELVVIDGVARYGTPPAMQAAGAAGTTVAVAGADRTLALERPLELDPDHQPGDPPGLWTWTEVVDRLQEVRADPKAAVTASQRALAAYAGRMDEPGAPLRLALDMPTGVAPVGGLPKDLGLIVIPPLETLTPDDEWLASLASRGFHGGVLADVASFY